jgi:hypothetical protein
MRARHAIWAAILAAGSILAIAVEAGNHAPSTEAGPPITTRLLIDYVLGVSVPLDTSRLDLNGDSKVDAADVVDRVNHTPTPSPTPSPTSLPGTPEQRLSQQTFGSAYSAADIAQDAIDTMAEAVWGATELAGGTAQNPTLTGTLTQAAPDSDVWTYSATPIDRMLVVYSGGPTVELVIASFAGWVNGTWQDFTDSHLVDFNAAIAGSVDMRIQSQTGPNGDDIAWNRTITGWITHSGEAVTLNVTHTGRYNADIGSPISLYEYWEQTSGTASSPSGAIVISETYWAYYSHDSDWNRHVFNFSITNNSSATRGVDTYQYQNANATWEYQSCYYCDPLYANVVGQASYWTCGGVMLKNGAQFGAVQFDGAVVEGTHGPELILRTTGGQDYFLHTLIPYP